jgi:predicted nicotinamide N-methyase
MSNRRTFILSNTRLQRPPHVPELQLYLADEVMPTWQRFAQELGDEDVVPPYWAFAWAGGQAVARYLLDYPDEAAGKQVIDLATGSGICAFAALKAGAASVLASDIDLYSGEAVALNAQANDVSVAFTDRDLLVVDPPDVDLILAGDLCYEQPMAGHVGAWLRAAAARGIRVLIGDPGRQYFSREGLIRLAEYEIQTTHELEDRDVKRAGVYTFASDPASDRT